MTLISQYSKLKEEIILRAGHNFSLQKVKDYFKEDINSHRSLSRVNSLPGIISLLEERDILTERNVSALHYLGELLSNKDVIELVFVYTSTYLDDCDSVCCCGTNLKYAPHSHPLSSIETQYNQSSNSNNISKVNIVDELGEAIKNISLTIGKEWRTLARELDIREYHIDKITAAHPNNNVEQTQLALEIWCKTEKENATLSKLDSILESRLCKRKGIGIHLRKPVIDLPC